MIRSSVATRNIARRATFRRSQYFLRNNYPFIPETQQSSTAFPSLNFGKHIRNFTSSVDILEKEHDENAGTRRRFEELDLHPKSLKALRRHGLHNLTEIQEKTFDVVLSGQDVVGRARTGTGKTLSFLLPALERITRQKELRPGIQILILSPTRELAAQIGREAERLVQMHDKRISSQVVYGGSSRMEDIDRFNHQLPTILVATPGRLKDHLASTNLVKGPFIDAIQNLSILVLDETDRLLDMGFRQDVQHILSCIPSKRRQTLLFSATLPPNVNAVVKLATKPNYQLVDCVQDEDPATHTNAQTEQSYITLPAHRFWSGSMEILLNLMDRKNGKIMVFFPMTSLVQLYSTIISGRFGRRVWELHGKMHQRERTTISRRFRNASKGVLFTSDVSARGVDYPDVTDVVQIGASNSRETYIHRLGRTGRAGKKGNGLLILPELEEYFLEDLDGLNISHDKQLQNKLCAGPSRRFMNELGPLAQDVRSGRDRKLESYTHDAYQAMVSYYYQKAASESEEEFVATVNHLVHDVGMRELPAIDNIRAKKIGIDDIPGLNIARSWRDQSWTDSWERPRSQNSKESFGKPFGDFDHWFDDSNRLSIGDDNNNNSSWNENYSPRRSRHSKLSDDDFGRGRRSGRRRSESFSDRRSRNNPRDGNDRSSNRREKRSKSRDGHDKKRKNNNNDDRFVELGYKSNGNMNRKKARNQRGAFQRWETQGEFRNNPGKS